MALDTLVSQIAYRAHLLERALHDEGPWTMRFSVAGAFDLGAPVTKHHLENGISLVAQFPGAPPCRGEVTLYLRGESVAVFPADASPDGFTVEWAMRGWVTDESRHS